MGATPFKDLIEAAATAKFVVIPASDYPVVCRDATATKSSTSKDMIKYTVKVLVGPHKGATIPSQQTLTVDNPAATAMFMKWVAAWGVTDDDLMALPPREDGGPNIAALASMLKGRVAMAVVTEGEWNDEPRNYVDRCRPLNSEQKAAVEEAMKADGQSLSDPLGGSGGAADPFAAASAPAAAAKSSEEAF